jgi:ubiquinone biosynthesis protein Coq4
MNTVRQALTTFLEANHFSIEAYDAPTVAIPIGPITFALPNSAGRKRLVRWHDLHHVLTGYGTDLIGEGEIGAWELRAGCTNLAGYVYNGLAAATGLLLSPRRVVRAYRRARGATTLYRLGLGYDETLALDVDALRARVGVFRAPA